MAQGDGFWGHSFRAPYVSVATWYYPYEVLVDGCRVWLEKQKAKKKEQATQKKAA